MQFDALIVQCNKRKKKNQNYINWTCIYWKVLCTRNCYIYIRETKISLIPQQAQLINKIKIKVRRLY